MWLLAAPHEDENKEKYNPPLHSSPEGNKKSNNERPSKKFPSNGGVSRSDEVGVVYAVILSGVFPRENLIFKSF